MNKYPSGYALVSLISVFGWIIIVASIIGGLFMLSSAPAGMRYIGWIVAIAGSVQGLLLSGMGAIGLAILDGSIAQQGILSVLNERGSVSSSKSSHPIENDIDNDLKPLPDNKQEAPTQDYRGVRMDYMRISGKYMVEGKTFEDKFSARRYVDEIVRNR